MLITKSAVLIMYSVVLCLPEEDTYFVTLQRKVWGQAQG